LINKEELYVIKGMLDERLFVLNLEVNDRKEVIENLGRKLLDYGYVKEGFIEAVLEREEKSPTGLPTFIPTALPHADAKYSLKPGLAMATLKKPVRFREMGNPKKTLKVELVFLVALNDPKKEVLLLKQLVQILHGEEQIKRILCVQNSSKVMEVLFDLEKEGGIKK
jgi:PTS system galactitol-specific IIA component